MGVTARRVLIFLGFANVLLGVGLTAPCLVIEPRFGELTTLVQIFSPSYRGPRPISVIGGISSLWSHGEHLLAGFLFLFSVALPLIKLGVMYSGVWCATHGKPLSAHLHSIEWLGKYSLIDVYVMALLALTVKALPGGSEVHVSWGLLPFAVSGLILLRIPKEIELLAARSEAGSTVAITVPETNSVTK